MNLRLTNFFQSKYLFPYAEKRKVEKWFNMGLVFKQEHRDLPKEGMQKPVFAHLKPWYPQKGKHWFSLVSSFLNLHVGMVLVIHSIKIHPDYLPILHFPALLLSRQFSNHSQNTSHASWEKAIANQEFPNKSWNIKLIIWGMPLLPPQVFMGSREVLGLLQRPRFNLGN